jgi:S-adenosylmethionine:tRNA ribosyltransferase-isomerase
LLTSDFDFELPQDRIAQYPVEPRDASRLLVVDRDKAAWRHRHFRDLAELLRPGDVLVRNNSRVLPARLLGRRAKTRGAWEGLFLHENSDGNWEILASTRGRPQPGEWIEIDESLRIQLLARTESGGWIARPDSSENVHTLLERSGRIPLPPYIRKGVATSEDSQHYQTEYAQNPGSVAAPTAGLHFSRDLLEILSAKGIQIVDLTLHVGVGTFRPIEAPTIEGHTLHEEHAQLSEGAAATLNTARKRGQRIVAVGTTSARVLETAAKSSSGAFEPFEGGTSLYIKPGHTFRGLDALITNFHLPRSSLLVLVSAFAGTKLVRAAYDEALREGYRFYSYGDAMMLF